MATKAFRLARIALVAAFAGCGPQGGTIEDEIPPTSAGRVVIGEGKGVPFDGLLLASSRTVQVVLSADEPADILYTLDGSEPTPDNRKISVGGRSTFFIVDRDTKVRWRARDTAGNLEPVAHEGEIKFDREPPVLTVEPRGGTFAGKVRVRVTTDEPAKVLWAFDDRFPFEGSAFTQVGDSPVEFVVDRTTRVNVRAIDPAGNSVVTESLAFEVDAQAPSTRAVPPGGRYFGPIDVAIVSDDGDATIRYTTDGSVPTTESPVYAGPVRIEADTILRFRGVDAGGNFEAVHIERYTVGPATLRSGTTEGKDVFAVGGALGLAGALLDAAGPLSGRDGASGFGRDWQAWAAGRTAAVAYLLQSGVGLHALYSPAVRALAASEAGTPDGNGNGTNLDETFATLLGGLAARTGATPPEGLFPLYGFYEFGQSRLIRPLETRNDSNGLPPWAADFLKVRWEGTGGRGRVLTADALAGGLAALTAQARSATAGEHLVAGGSLGADVAPVVALRCAGCHRAGAVEPPLTTPAQWHRAALVTPGAPGDSPLVALLSGAAAHHGDRATPEQVAKVSAWIADGANDDPEAEMKPGFEAVEGFYGLLAAAQAGWAVDRVVESGVFDVATSSLGALAEGEGVRFTAARVAVTEAAAAPGLPRRPDRIRLEDPSFDTGPHARLLAALVDLHRLFAARGDLANAGVRARVAALARAEASALLALAWDEGAGAFRSGWHPADGAAPDVDVAAAADAATALLELASDGPEGLDAEEAATRTIDFLAGVRDASGAYAGRWYPDRGADASERPRLDVQLAVLDALVARAALAGDGAAGEDARALWAHLEAVWWDDATGIWQTALGEPEATYDTALAARVVRTLARGAAAGVLEGAGARLARFHDVVVARGLRPSETWLTGEIGSAADADGDGVPKPWGVSLGNGVAPGFALRVVFR